MISEKCSKWGADYLDQGAFARKAHKKQVYTCGATLIGQNTGVCNALAGSLLSLLDNFLVFCFQSGVSGQISALMLEASFLCEVADLPCTNPEFERLILRKRGSDAMF